MVTTAKPRPPKEAPKPEIPIIGDIVWYWLEAAEIVDLESQRDATRRYNLARARGHQIIYGSPLDHVAPYPMIVVRQWLDTDEDDKTMICISGQVFMDGPYQHWVRSAPFGPETPGHWGWIPEGAK